MKELSTASADSASVLPVVSSDSKSSSKSSSGSGGSGSGSSGGGIIAVPACVANQSVGVCESWLAAIRSILNSIRSARTTQLIMLRESARYAERLAQSVRQLSASSDRLRQSALSADTRLTELNQTRAQSEVRLRRYAAQSLSIKRQLEAAISKMYDGRRVNIFGSDLSTLPALLARS